MDGSSETWKSSPNRPTRGYIMGGQNERRRVFFIVGSNGGKVDNDVITRVRLYNDATGTGTTMPTKTLAVASNRPNNQGSMSIFVLQ